MIFPTIFKETFNVYESLTIWVFSVIFVARVRLYLRLVYQSNDLSISLVKLLNPMQIGTAHILNSRRFILADRNAN